jgi:hypothetical protein
MSIITFDAKYKKTTISVDIEKITHWEIDYGTGVYIYRAFMYDRNIFNMLESEGGKDYYDNWLELKKQYANI